MSPKIMDNISNFMLIIADFIKNNRLMMSVKESTLWFFKSFTFFSGTTGKYPTIGKSSVKKLFEKGSNPFHTYLTLIQNLL